MSEPDEDLEELELDDEEPPPASEEIFDDVQTVEQPLESEPAVTIVVDEIQQPEEDRSAYIETVEEVIEQRRLSEKRSSLAKGICHCAKSVVFEEEELTFSYLKVIPPNALQFNIQKTRLGFGFSIAGGKDDPRGDGPLIIKKLFRCGSAERQGFLAAGDKIIGIDGISTRRMTRPDLWKVMQKIHPGDVNIVVVR